MPRSDGYKNLIPRKKGDRSLLGAGRPKGVSTRTIMKKLLEERITIRDAGRMKKLTRAEAIAMALIKDALDPNNKASARIRTTEAIMNRVEGRPPQQVATATEPEVIIHVVPEEARL